MSPKHQSLNVSCLCVACVSVWSWSALQFALQDLKIALTNTPSVQPLFVLYCIVYYKSMCVCVCVCVFSTEPCGVPQVCCNKLSPAGLH